MSKRKLTLSVEDNRIKTLKVKGIQHDLSVSELVEVFAIVAERDKKLFKDMVDKYKLDVSRNKYKDTFRILEWIKIKNCPPGASFFMQDAVLETLIRFPSWNNYKKKIKNIDLRDVKWYNKYIKWGEQMEEKIKKFFKVINLILVELEKTIDNSEKLILKFISLAGWILYLLEIIK